MAVTSDLCPPSVSRQRIKLQSRVSPAGGAAASALPWEQRTTESRLASIGTTVAFILEGTQMNRLKNDFPCSLAADYFQADRPEKQTMINAWISTEDERARERALAGGAASSGGRGLRLVVHDLYAPPRCC